MSITVEVSLSALEDPNVAGAVSRLLNLLSAGAMDAPRVSAGAQAAAVADPDLAYERFLEALPDRSRRFIELVHERGTLTIDEAMRELDITVAKAVGGVTGSIARWAPRSGVSVPYVAVKVRGRRAWRWTGPPARTPSVAPAPVRPLPEYAPELPGTSRRFLQVLYSRGELKTPDVLELFDLPRPRSIGGITEPIARVARDLGVELPFETMKTDDGVRVWRAT